MIKYVEITVPSEKIYIEYGYFLTKNPQRLNRKLVGYGFPKLMAIDKNYLDTYLDFIKNSS